MCEVIQGTLKYKIIKDIQIKFYEVTAAPMLMYASENWL
jgi:hypothetical protein